MASFDKFSGQTTVVFCRVSRRRPKTLFTRLAKTALTLSAARNAPVSGFYLGIPPLLSRSLYIANNCRVYRPGVRHATSGHGSCTVMTAVNIR